MTSVTCDEAKTLCEDYIDELNLSLAFGNRIGQDAGEVDSSHEMEKEPKEDLRAIGGV